MIRVKVKKQHFPILCACCGRILSKDSGEKPFHSEIMHKENEDSYDKITRCPKCLTWNGVYKS